MNRKVINAELIKIDHSAPDVPESVKNFRPDMYQDDGTYYATLGNGDDTIIGCGATIDEAMVSWDAAYWNKQYRKE
ncbi:hypothetical protein LZZ85_22415 [Terrimonas sp. NA20]|uniref:Uncharacterized protein n=1 Tax=Terrimonas ginsenosidimutans TaxID=2908004 RepID=A0ABS9KXJ2_9BACT|nr:hypothetical protein [Terrimonas ginsenosidimutans]MCG2617067.1 hypothetical protein [Terrimonas ginsenosidimutans]